MHFSEPSECTFKQNYQMHIIIFRKKIYMIYYRPFYFTLLILTFALNLRYNYSYDQ